MKTKINNIFKKIKNFVKSHYIISGVITIVIIFIGYGVFASGNGGVETVVVKNGDVIQKVIVNGKTKAVREVNLGFENNGKVAREYVTIGARVVTGQAVASLDSSEMNANLLKAEANVASEQARLDELKKGTRPEELAIAQSDVSNAKNTITSEIFDGWSRADDAVHNSIDQLFSNPKTNSPQFNFNITDSQLKSDINSERIQIETLLTVWNSKLSDISKEGIEKSKLNLTKVKSFIDKVSLAINSQSGGGGISQATIDAYKSAVSSARSSVSTAISNVTTAQSTLVSKEGTLFLKQNGNTKEVVDAQAAKVMQNQAEVQSIEAQLGKMTLRSPINGIVTKQDAKVGEIVTPGKIVVSIISDNDLEIESDVSEISIGKVAIGNPVSITFDAFPSETFNGKVSYIEPAETIVDGVVNYKVTVAFVEKYSQVKSGLTSKLEIETAVKNDVLTVPQYALIRKDSGVFVSKQNGNDFVETPVTLGIVGQNGFTEVISGISAGDTIKSVAPVN